MAKTDVVVAVAGWEERFALGIERDVERYSPREAVVICFDEYNEVTAHGRRNAASSLGNAGCSYSELNVPREPVEIWRRCRDVFFDQRWSSKSVLVDITTMPREVIYWSMSFLLGVGATVRYIYHLPGAYSSDWVSRDTDRPRLVYQHSGISGFGKGTCLLLISGFDTDRAAQLLQFFEPRSVLVGVQTGSQFENESKNLDANRALLERRTDVTFFPIDAYAPDHGFSAIHRAVSDKADAFNIVAASLGPKPSAIALYRLHCLHTEIALVYAPSRQFNMGYSSGIGESIAGELDFEPCKIDLAP
jgi:hypothetical protein